MNKIIKWFSPGSILFLIIGILIIRSFRWINRCGECYNLPSQDYKFISAISETKEIFFGMPHTDCWFARMCLVQIKTIPIEWIIFIIIAIMLIIWNLKKQKTT